MDTQPGRRARPPQQDTELAGRAAGAEDGTQLAGRAASGGRQQTELPGQAAGGVVRFGPGVTAAPAWSVSAPANRRRRPRRLVTPVLTTLALAGVLACLLLWRPDPLAVASAEVAPATPPGTACDVTVDLVGTIHTNGQPGVIEYHWQRSDGETTASLTQTVDAGQSVVQVHLLWTLAGRGRYPASAVLQIQQPQPVTATGGFTYSCR